MKIRLTEQDFENLLPGSSLKIGKTTIKINPFSLLDLKELYVKIESDLKENNINIDNFHSNIGALTRIISDKAPETISEVTNIEQEDIDRLPACEQIRIIDKIVAVNQKSFDGLEKNLPALQGLLPSLLRGVTGIASSFSSTMDTAGLTSKNTPLVK